MARSLRIQAFVKNVGRWSVTHPLILPWNLPYQEIMEIFIQGNYQCTLPNIPEERKSGRKVLRTVRSVS